MTTNLDPIRYVVYQSHLGGVTGVQAEGYAAALADALRAAYPGREVEVEVRAGVEGVGSGLQGEPEGVDDNLVRWLAEQTDIPEEPVVECAYCGVEGPACAPLEMDDADWDREAHRHGPGCEWVATRAHSRDASDLPVEVADQWVEAMSDDDRAAIITADSAEFWREGISLVEPYLTRVQMDALIRHIEDRVIGESMARGVG